VTSASTYRYHVDGTLPSPSAAVFVFGSNLAGRHGRGGALAARRHFLAQRGVGFGPTGRAFAIPTKDGMFNVLTLEQIKLSVDAFLDYAAGASDEQFFVSRIGCGEAGYRDDQIAPMFRGAPRCCSFAEQWRQFLG
jgi:hypothetical protein